jgi:hypothetical protein
MVVNDVHGAEAGPAMLVTVGFASIDGPDCVAGDVQDGNRKRKSKDAMRYFWV